MERIPLCPAPGSLYRRAFPFLPSGGAVNMVCTAELFPVLPEHPVAARKHSSLQQRVFETITRHALVHPGDRVAVGVSGGADSVALLLLLEELAPKLGVRLLVCHFNHQLRGAAADVDEAFVAGLARSHGLEFFAAREDVAGRASDEGWNLEDAARRLRYGFFSRLVEEGRADCVAVAHSADDQAETVLAHLMRGTGPTGLGGIYPVVGHVVRPLLDVRRQELRDYLRARGQEWREDESNRDQARLRARIRHQLLPVLERDFQPAMVENLARLAGLAREEERFWMRLLDDRLAALMERTAHGLSIRAADLLQPLRFDTAEELGAAGNSLVAVTRRLIRRLLEEVRGSRQQFTAQHVEQIIHLAATCESGHRVELPGGVVAERVFDRLIFSCPGSSRPAQARRETGLASSTYQYVVDLTEGGSACISVPEIRRRFRLKVVDWPLTASDTTVVASAAALDADRLRPPLVLRNWRPGDGYRPVGRRRVRKLKQLLLEGRVAARDRTGWPVLTSDGSLVWARGFPVAAEFAPQAATRVGLVIAEEEL